MNNANHATGFETNTVAYNRADYPDKERMLHHILSTDKRHAIDLQQLSVNGTLAKDSMAAYLSAALNSSSALREILKTPLHYQHYQHAPFADKDRDYFDLGTFAHQAFLEPDKFDRCVVEPVASLASIEGVTRLINFWEAQYLKEARTRREFEDALEVCRESVTREHALDLNKLAGKKAYYRTLRALSKYTGIEERHREIIDAVRNNYYIYGGGIIPRIMRGAECEVSFYGVDALTRLPVKIRPDAFQIKENIGVDAIISFKTTHADTVEKFMQDAARYQYELAEGMYQEVASSVTSRRFNSTIMVMLQTVPPYLPAVFWWSAEDLQSGKHKYRHALRTLQQCRQRNVYQGFDALAGIGNHGVLDTELPAWSRRARNSNMAQG